MKTAKKIANIYDVVSLETIYENDTYFDRIYSFCYLAYYSNVRDSHLWGLSIYFDTILSLRTVLKKGTQYFLVIQLVAAILIL